MIQMTVGVDNPLDIGGVETRLPDRLYQQGSRSGVAAVDQQKAVTGIDQVDANPAVTDVPNVAKNAEGMYIALFLVQPQGTEMGGCHVFTALCICLIILFHTHIDSPHIIDCSRGRMAPAAPVVMISFSALRKGA